MQKMNKEEMRIREEALKHWKDELETEWSRRGIDKKVDMDEDSKNIASNAYRLLSEWKNPPGLHEDDVFYVQGD